MNIRFSPPRSNLGIIELEKRFRDEKTQEKYHELVGELFRKTVTGEIPQKKLVYEVSSQKGEEECSEVILDCHHAYKSDEEHQRVTWEKLSAFAKKIPLATSKFNECSEEIIEEYEKLWEVDPSLAAAAYYHFVVCGGILSHLADTAQKKLIEGIDDMSVVPCLMLHEIGNGPNMTKVNTTATYDVSRDCFELYTPNPKSCKLVIGNMEAEQPLGICYAALIIDGKDYGPHAFLVPLNHSDTSKKITVKKCHSLDGLTGVPRYQVEFKRLPLSLNCLLGKHSTVLSGGAFSSALGQTKLLEEMMRPVVQGSVYQIVSSSKVISLVMTLATKHLSLPPEEKTLLVVSAVSGQAAKRYALENRENPAIVLGVKAILNWKALFALQRALDSCCEKDTQVLNILYRKLCDFDLSSELEGNDQYLLEYVAYEMRKHSGSLTMPKNVFDTPGNFLKVMMRHMRGWNEMMNVQERKITMHMLFTKTGHSFGSGSFDQWEKDKRMMISMARQKHHIVIARKVGKPELFGGRDHLAKVMEKLYETLYVMEEGPKKEASIVEETQQFMPYLNDIINHFSVDDKGEFDRGNEALKYREVKGRMDTRYVKRVYGVPMYCATDVFEKIVSDSSL